MNNRIAPIIQTISLHGEKLAVVTLDKGTRLESTIASYLRDDETSEQAWENTEPFNRRDFREFDMKKREFVFHDERTSVLFTND